MSALPAEAAAVRPSPGGERNVAAFLERFFRFGAEPSVATYMPLFHRDVTLFDDGMARPIGYEEIPASITAPMIRMSRLTTRIVTQSGSSLRIENVT